MAGKPSNEIGARTLGERVKHFRTLRGLSQAQLASAASGKQQAIAKLEVGLTRRPRNLPEIAAALGVDVHELLGNHEPRNPVGLNGTWDQSEFDVAASLADEFLESVGNPKISKEDYVQTVRRFYVRVRLGFVED